MTRPLTDSWLGRLLDGRWRVLELLSHGAMGRVYRAEHLELGRQVAVKVLNDAASADEGYRLRFRREAMVVGRLAHPNIVGALDVGTHDDSLYLVLELLDGQPLDVVLREQGVFSLERVIAGHLHHAAAPLSQRRPDVPASFAALVHAMLEKDPAHRPADGLAVFDALKPSERNARPTTSAVLMGVRLNDADSMRRAIGLTNELGLEVTHVQGRSLLVHLDAAELGFQAAERFVQAMPCATVLHEGAAADGPTVRVVLELLRLASEGGVMVTRHAHASLGLGFRARLSNRRQRLVDGGAAGGLTVFELPGADLEAHAATLVRGVKSAAGVDFSCACGTRGHVPSLSSGSARVRCGGCSGLLEVVAAERDAPLQPPSVIVAPGLVEAPAHDDEDALILASLSSLTGAST